MSDANYEALAARIAREKARLSELAAEQAEVSARLTTLKAQLPTAPDSASAPPEQTRTNAEKIALFRSLFRGRTDVFPKYWHNPKKGRKGYAPACANEWVHGICEKPRVKCGECPNQAFLAVTDQIIGDHLRGRHVAGVYPLLADETCWFLALDFDKGDWQADVAAFKATAQRFDLDPAVERSRSGSGAHVWFFFSEPVPANAARNMGCYLITETMARRDELPMSSYDRFFPSQDTMPRGGFGNLIALPLQHEFRQQGNTLFVDENWIPYPDQWIYLASITRLKAARIHELARAAEAADRVIGAPRWDSEEETAGELSLERPSWKGRVPFDGPLPAGTRCVLASQLLVDKEGLPPIIINQIKRLAAFQNPEFYKKQGMRLSTALTPRVISCVEEDDTCVALPRGCLQDLAALLEGNGVAVSVDDQRTDGKPFPLAWRADTAAAGRCTSGS